MFNKVLFGLFGLLLMSQVLHAKECGPFKVKAIQSQQTTVLVYVENSDGKYWKNLGYVTDLWMNSYQSLVQQAMVTQQNIWLRYPAEHECSSTDYETATFMVRVKEG